MDKLEFRTMSDELYPLRENGKVTVMSEWKWLESKGAGKIVVHLGKEIFTANVEKYPIYSKKLSDWWRHLGKIEYAKQKQLEHYDHQEF